MYIMHNGGIFYLLDLNGGAFDHTRETTRAYLEEVIVRMAWLAPQPE